MPKIISNGQVAEFPSVGHGTLTVDDTLTKAEDGTIGVTSPVQSILTQEQFDALPEEEQNKGFYIISDGLSDSPSNGSSSNGSGEIYSTEETVIGTWLEKPLYRRVLSGSETASTTLTTKNLITDSTIVLKSQYGTIIATSNDDMNFPFPLFIRNSNGSITSLYLRKGSDGNISLVSFWGSGTVTFTYEIVIEYTKTTDIAE